MSVAQFNGSARFGLIAALLVFGFCVPAIAKDKPPANVRDQLTNLSEIELHYGVNEVELAGLHIDGENPERSSIVHSSGKILSVLHENSGAGSHRTYMVVTKGNEMLSNKTTTEWAVVPINYGTNGNRSENRLEEIISDGPYTADDWVPTLKSVRFFNGLLNGKPTTLIFLADRKNPRIGEGYEKPTSIRLSVFELYLTDLYGTPGVFELVYQSSVGKKYCSPDIALWKELGVPIPRINSQSPDLNGAC